MKFLDKLFGFSKEVRTIEQSAEEGTANVDRLANEAIERINTMTSEAIERINGGSNTKNTQSISRSYTLADAFASGSKYLLGSAEDFVKITYDFSTDCDSKDGWDLAFNPRYAASVPVHLPRSILPDERLETHRSCNWGNNWQYNRVQRAKAEFFVRKENLAKAMGSLENAINEISGSVKLDSYYEGHKECCYGKVYVSARSADGKRFEYDLLRAIKETKPTEQNLPSLRNLYDELGKRKIVAYLDKRIANRSDKSPKYPQLWSQLYNIQELNKENYLENPSNEELLDSRTRASLEETRKQAKDLEDKRNSELKELDRLYGSRLSVETLGAKKVEVISKYDPQIMGLCNAEDKLKQPLRQLKDIVLKVGDSEQPRNLFKEEYRALNRAYRIKNKS